MPLPHTVHTGTGIVGDRAEPPGQLPGGRGTSGAVPERHPGNRPVCGTESGAPCRSEVQKR